VISGSRCEENAEQDIGSGSQAPILEVASLQVRSRASGRSRRHCRLPRDLNVTARLAGAFPGP
jgi:hypothetical protein